MAAKVTVIDYGIGNLFSVCRAFESQGAEVLLSRNPDDLANAERLILPGVGAFADGMAGLIQHGFVDPIREYARSGRPFMGICLGMQMMLDTSEEFGTHRGLGLIPGKVTRIPSVTRSGEPLKVPHIGWNALRAPESRTGWHGRLFQGLEAGSSVYFVHSYHAEPANPAHILATTDYGGNAITAAIADGPVMGCQFHPERSGPVGLRIIRNFLALGRAF